MDEIIEKYEALRLSRVKRARIFQIIFIAAIVVTTICFITTIIMGGDTFVSIFAGINIVLFIIFISLFLAEKRKWYRFFKTTIVKDLIQAKYPGSVFNPDAGIDLNTLMKPEFFARPDRYYSNDLLVAGVDSTSFTMADYVLQKRHDDKDGYVNYQTYAEGRFFDFHFNRDFKNTVRVIEKQGFFTFGDKSKRVELESVDFNKKFNTYATDELTAFYILTPQVQEEMLRLESCFKGNIMFCFNVDHLYIAVNDGKDSFVSDLFKSISKENISKLVEEIEIPLNFINALKLNREKYSRDIDNDAI